MNWRRPSLICACLLLAVVVLAMFAVSEPAPDPVPPRVTVDTAGPAVPYQGTP